MPRPSTAYSKPSHAARIAEKRYQERTRQQSTSVAPEDVSFLDCVPEFSPDLLAPVWLTPLSDVLRDAFLAVSGQGEPVRACTSVPPQHGKTELLKHGIIQWLKHRPQDFILYLTYNKDKAAKEGRSMRDLAHKAGIEIRTDSSSATLWQTPQGGGLACQPIVGGAITGQPGVRLIIIDDPYKERAEVESPAMRRHVWDSFTSGVYSRLHGGESPTSVIVNHTRWHVDDLIGRLIKEHKWRYVNLRAINANGEALWKQNQPLELLAEKRALSEFDWWSLYMGEPRSLDSKIYPDECVSYFETLPESYRIAIGVDLAYSEKKTADWSVAVVLAESQGYYYVLDVERHQVDIDKFAAILKGLSHNYPGAPMVSHVARSEFGNIKYLKGLGVRIKGIDAQGLDKVIRSQPASTAWKSNRVYLRRGAKWIEPFVDVLTNFTGMRGGKDDDADAFASAVSQLPIKLGDIKPRAFVPSQMSLSHNSEPTRITSRVSIPRIKPIRRRDLASW